MAHNGKDFVQDGHSYSVAGLAGHRLVSFSLMSVGQSTKAGSELQKIRIYTVTRLA
jgi:hypothetical protein